MNINDLIPLLTAFGLGSIVSVLIQTWLQRRGKIDDRNFSEKKEACIGLLEAYHKAAVEPSEAASKNFAYWQMRCELVAPEKVRLAIEDTVSTSDDVGKRYVAHSKLKSALRRDLSVFRK